MEYYQIFGRETCSWCCEACAVLQSKNLNFMFCEMGKSPDLIAHHKEKFNMKTVPIIVKINPDEEDVLIGGYTDLIKYLENEKSK